MKKRLTSFLLVLALSFSLSLPVFAVDDMDYYSLSPVSGSEPSFSIDFPVSSAVSHDGFLAEDSVNLARIMTDLTTTGLTTLKSLVLDIRDALSRGGSIFDFLSDITDALTAQNVRGSLVWYIKDIDNLLSSIQTSLGGGLATEDTLSAISSKVATDSTLSAFSSAFQKRFGFDGYVSPESSDSYPYYLGWTSEGGAKYGSWGRLMEEITRYFGRDDITLYGSRTLYGRLAQLQEVLASDDDKELAESQKENREQIEQDFLSGSSGKTSLGKGDFSNASQVGGALNDTFNMGGAAKVSDFLSGFGSAGTESQAWFSQTTANNLNAVEAGDGTQGVSTFADDGETMVDVDPDPYNMANIFDRYDWLEGVNMDD